MKNYREVIYASYRSNIYGDSNSDDVEDIRARQRNYDLEFAKHIPEDKSAHILDLGCGSGFLVKYLMDRGYTNVIGIDTSDEQVEFAKKLELPVDKGDALEFLKSHKDFQLIISTDVIEHLTKQETIEFLNSIYNALNKGGCLILRTINAASIIGCHSRYIDFTHEISYTETSMRQILTAVGFNKVEITDRPPPVGLKPKRLARWILFHLWRSLLKLIYLIEVGEDAPKVLGKVLIARAFK